MRSYELCIYYGFIKVIGARDYRDRCKCLGLLRLFFMHADYWHNLVAKGMNFTDCSFFFFCLSQNAICLIVKLFPPCRVLHVQPVIHLTIHTVIISSSSGSNNSSVAIITIICVFILQILESVLSFVFVLFCFIMITLIGTPLPQGV